jgi:two-component system sensor histidine kinase KdpD
MRSSRHLLARYGLGIVATFAVTCVLLTLHGHTAIPNGSLLYVPVVLYVAVSSGTGPSLVTAVAAAVEYDYFLVQPVHTLNIGQLQDALALAVFVAVAFISGRLAGLQRERAVDAQRRARESATLYELSQALTTGQHAEEVLSAITRRVVEVFDVAQCAIFVPRGDGALQLAAETARGGVRDRASLAAARYVFEHGEPVARSGGASDDRSQQQLFVPLRTAGGAVGVMEVGRKRGGQTLDLDERRMVLSFGAQAALVLARARVEEEQQRVRLIEESDRLKSALLNAVSHDFRTPLSSIKASVTALLRARPAWSPEESLEMLQAIDGEADRLNRMVGNLLDLSRIEAGVLEPVYDLYTVDELEMAAARRLAPLHQGTLPRVQIDRSLPPMRLDLVRVEEVVFNLVENALKYGDGTRGPDIRIGREGDALAIAVEDHGPGIPRARRAQIFEPFFRLGDHTDRQPGTGLGLAVARGIAESHGGGIRVEETPGGGSTFVVTLPALTDGAMV